MPGLPQEAGPRSLSKLQGKSPWQPFPRDPRPGEPETLSPAGDGGGRRDTQWGGTWWLLQGLESRSSAGKMTHCSKPWKRYEGCEIIFVATEVMLKNETLVKCPYSSIIPRVCTGNCIKRTKPLLACLCFVHQMELCPAYFNLLFMFSKARAASKRLQKNKGPFLFFIIMRPFLPP